MGRSELKRDVPLSLKSHPGFRRIFSPGKMTLGLMFPIEPLYGHLFPRMSEEIALAKTVEDAGFGALWVRDVPLHVPSFKNVGQIFDIWIWLATIAAHTNHMALCTGALVLPLRHPIHTAKAAASLDILSGGRLVAGMASGDREIEYPAFNVDYDKRGEVFREHVAFYEHLLQEHFVEFENSFGHLKDADLIPKPQSERIPLLVVGEARQKVEWIAAHADGWAMYFREPEVQRERVQIWKDACNSVGTNVFKPFVQGLNLDLVEDADAKPEAIRGGWKVGNKSLLEKLKECEAAGVNHTFIHCWDCNRPTHEIIEELTETILPHFPVDTSVPARSMSSFDPDSGAQ